MWQMLNNVYNNLHNALEVMEMLKTYIGIIDTMKKYEVAQYLKYLISDTHKNHVGRTEILSNSQDYKNFFKLNSDKIRGNIRMKQKMKKDKKRGWHTPTQNSNKSLTFNVPISYNASDNDLIHIQNELMAHFIELYKSKGFEVDEEDFFSNIHKQRNNHINFIIPGIDKKSNYFMKFVNAVEFRPLLTEKFTEIVDKRLGTNIFEYNSGNETMAVMEHEEKRLREFDYSLEELEKLAAEKYQNKMLKNLYKMFVRLKKEEIEQKDNSKTLKRVENTLKKLEQGEKATKEEKQQARDILADLNAGEILTEEQRKEIRKETKEYNNHKK